MIRLNGEPIALNHFPDGTLLLKKDLGSRQKARINWQFESNEEMVAVIFLTKHLQTHGVKEIYLDMAYIPNARQDRVKGPEDVFTLKYFAEVINSLQFTAVTVLDPHSAVSEALIDRIEILSPKPIIQKAIRKIGKEDLLLFYPDDGAMKRYAGMLEMPYVYGVKYRDWETGKILGLDVAGCIKQIVGRDILIIDDICSKGGTFFYGAQKLKKLGAANVYLYVSHCENTILEGKLLSSGLVEKVFTTDSLYTAEHERVEVIYHV